MLREEMVVVTMDAGDAGLGRCGKVDLLLERRKEGP